MWYDGRDPNAGCSEHNGRLAVGIKLGMCERGFPTMGSTADLEAIEVLYFHLVM